MAYKPRFGSKHREDLWAREVLHAYRQGRGGYPICNLCDGPVKPDQPWHESHCPSRPKAFGGKSVGIAHEDCNLEHGAKVVTPAVAKAERVRKKHVGIKGPGLGRSPMRCGRRSRERKTMRHGVQPRLSYAEQHRDFLRRRYFLEVEDFSAPLEVSLSAPIEVSPDGGIEVQP